MNNFGPLVTPSAEFWARTHPVLQRTSRKNRRGREKQALIVAALFLWLLSRGGGGGRGFKGGEGVGWEERRGWRWCMTIAQRI